MFYHSLAALACFIFLTYLSLFWHILALAHRTFWHILAALATNTFRHILAAYTFHMFEMCFAIPCDTMRYHHTMSNCLKPQSLFRSALSPSRASSPAARFQWTDVDTPERYPAIHFKNGHVTCYLMLGHIRLYYNHEAMSNAVKCFRLKTSQKLLAPEKVFCFQMFSDKTDQLP
jgi:hypothetical protein